MKKVSSLLWGFVLIILGVIFALNSLGVAEINVFFKGWWTLFIIIPSFIGLFKDSNKTWSFIWLCVGIILLLCIRDVISFSLVSKLIFPFILIVLGLSLIFKDTLNKRINEQIKKLNSEKIHADSYCATFGEVSENFNGEEFKGANIDAIFGSVNLDISDATIKQDQIINSNAIFGGVDIKVANSVNIKVKSTPIFGGVNNKVKNTYNNNLPTIYINSFCLFGGVEIK